MTWPAELPVPEGTKTYDPKGPLSQFDALAANQDPEDPTVKAILELRDLKVALEKLEMENSARTDKSPPGLVTLADGSIDKDHYVKNQGFHPSFIPAIQATIDAEAKTHPKPKKDTAWADAMAKIKPMLQTEHERLVAESREIAAKKKELEATRDRLDEITVDEMLEMYPELAQEIKDEIEAGHWEPTDAGFKLPATTK